MNTEKDYSDDYVPAWKRAYIGENYKGPSKEKSTMKTFAIAGIAFSLIGLLLNLWIVYGYDQRLALSILSFFALFYCNLNNLNE